MCINLLSSVYFSRWLFVNIKILINSYMNDGVSQHECCVHCFVPITPAWPGRQSVNSRLGRVAVASTLTDCQTVSAASSHGRPGGLPQRLGEHGADNVVDEWRRVGHPLDSHHLADRHCHAARLGHGVDDVGECQRQPEYRGGDEHGTCGPEQIQFLSQSFVR